MEPKNSACARPTFVTTPITGRAIDARWRISPEWFMPISRTAARASSGTRRIESGSPTWLFRLPSVLATENSVASSAAIVSFVVVFPALPVTAITVPPHSLRDNLRTALGLLKEAGWTVADDGLLRNAKGEPFEFEVLSYSKALERIAVPWARNLEKLGIAAHLRVTDPALYQKRTDEFDFDVAIHLYAASQTPGNELLERFTSAAADEKGSDNLAGIRDPAVDAIVQRLLSSRTRAELVTAARALDRVLRAGWYLVPHFYAPSHRVAWRARLFSKDLAVLALARRLAPLGVTVER